MLNSFREEPARGQTYRALFVDSVAKSLELARNCGAKRFVLISAADAPPSWLANDPTAFFEAKLEGERQLDGLQDMSAAVFRPGKHSLSLQSVECDF